MRSLWRGLRRRVALRLALLVRSAEGEVDRLSLPRFANAPANLRIDTPRRIVNPACISIGDDVSLGPGCLLNAIRRYPGAFMAGAPDVERQDFEPSIRIGHRVSATGYLTIGAVDAVVIEDDALLASHIFIGDNLHGTDRIDLPYKYQPLARIAPVTIGRGCWIGEHVVILPGVTVGEFAIVGANSVVTDSIPPRSVAVGAPARVIRRWSDQEAGWVDA
jgi:acetyltransferase-like isoleucine patch superfamily enzyme